VAFGGEVDKFYGTRKTARRSSDSQRVSIRVVIELELLPALRTDEDGLAFGLDDAASWD
jgi:hypothetical protein